MHSPSTPPGWFIARLHLGDERGVAAAAAVVNAALGHGVLTVDRLLRHMRDDERVQFLAAFPQGSMTPVGAALAQVIDDEEYRAFIAPMPQGILSPAPPSADGRRVGILSTMAVVPSVRRRGLGTALAVQRTAWLRERCTEAYAMVWLRDRPGRADGVLKAAGWEPVTTVRRYWEQASVAGDCHCHRCGSPCRCDGLLMRLNPQLFKQADDTSAWPHGVTGHR
ncbi:GNAT family N-acetyltransferase [Nonomuraea aurantiaca]|jgi:GNAT superfamily N-acetyltransferase|uniref:GNAT family N-acetyltransferase n=1 Tax=Nonomuraea aurantiaca TaxID=2878562 RepID=UPI001CD9DC9A|nr:GNAT family N-acetyltransferase [Nonomuraea aurantiaca]MCA2223585.1 GNAT family N-acetyltransferase [Nonomuraea aurantiaca]